MNKHIKQCWDQAVNNDDSWDGHVKFMEKFAELIVRECAQRIDYWESRQGEHTDDILKHFGVEE